MKRIFLVLSIILLLGIVYIALMNTSNPANINLLYNNMLDTQTKVDLSTQGAYLYKSINLSVYTIIVLLSGMFVGAGIVYMFLSATNEKVKAYQRELEKTSISGLNNASRVEVLE
ncbi:MAG: hypothetical protein K2F57_00400, partial [Candidatus Gastranaerophilales bacterium]|nr:hypothetical protein [Candidatus Gastranaerophilales bacterium]